MPKPLLRMTKNQATSGKKLPVAQVKAVKPPISAAKTSAPVASFFTQDGKPDPNGLFDRDGYQVRLTVPKVVAKQEADRPDSAAARRAGFKR